MSKKKFIEKWNLVATSVHDADIANSCDVNERCACCLRGAVDPGKPISKHTFSHRYENDCKVQQWLCFSCAKNYYHVDLQVVRMKYRKYYNVLRFAHLLPKIESAQAQSRVPLPDVVDKFYDFYYRSPPTEIPRNVLLGVNEWLRKWKR